jgi:hypothetical protein
MTSELSLTFPRVNAGTPVHETSPIPGFPRRGGRWRKARCVANAMILGTIGLAMAACAGDKEAAEAAANASIGVQTSQLFVTIENKAGAPLVNITVAILSVAGQPFTRLVSRLENGEKRDLALGDFGGRDGTPFSLRVVRPRTVRVTAEDVANKKYEVDVPWR